MNTLVTANAQGNKIMQFIVVLMAIIFFYVVNNTTGGFATYLARVFISPKSFFTGFIPVITAIILVIFPCWITRTTYAKFAAIPRTVFNPLLHFRRTDKKWLSTRFADYFYPLDLGLGFTSMGTKQAVSFFNRMLISLKFFSAEGTVARYPASLWVFLDVFTGHIFSYRLPIIIPD